jgi:hypothetical protein
MGKKVFKYCMNVDNGRIMQNTCYIRTTGFQSWTKLQWLRTNDTDKPVRVPTEFWNWRYNGVQLLACPFTLCRGCTPKIVGTFYMQGYKVKENTAIVPHCTSKLEHLYIWHIFWEISRLSIPITVWSLKWIGKGVLNLQHDIRKIAYNLMNIHVCSNCQIDMQNLIYASYIPEFVKLSVLSDMTCKITILCQSLSKFAQILLVISDRTDNFTNSGIYDA